ncbi:MAG: glycosyltransferase family 2 protein [Herbinix sp.]|jgi:putative flippase GtrA|nr:glycosyltransferase family 2 protein [Herbinix sp.]
MKIIIPAYEPNYQLISLIHNIQSNCDHDIIIVNDGSSINCNQIFQEAGNLGCTVLTHNINQGKGAALKTAFSYLISSRLQDDLVCTDCDGQHAWQDILKIANSVQAHTNSIVLGCREFAGKVPTRSILGNKITSFIYYLITKRRITDTQTGLRGFSSSMLPWLAKVKGNRYEYEMNQLLEARTAGYDLFVIPIETIYENNNESSHFNPIIDSIRIYLPIMKFMLSSVTCGIIDFIALFILNSLTNNLLISVITARIISSVCNYYINRTMVFHSKNSNQLSSILKYYALAIVILGCNYSLISLLVTAIGLPLVIGKLVTECVLYLFSYIVQHRFIFKK